MAETSVVGISKCDAHLPLAPALDFNARLATRSVKALDRDEWPRKERSGNAAAFLGANRDGAVISFDENDLQAWRG